MVTVDTFAEHAYRRNYGHYLLQSVRVKRRIMCGAHKNINDEETSGCVALLSKWVPILNYHLSINIEVGKSEEDIISKLYY